MAIQRVRLSRFSGFHEANLSFVPGINVLIGVNGSCKSHLLKLLYSVWKTAEDHGRKPQRALEIHLGEKLAGVFKPAQDAVGRLVRRGPGKRTATVSVTGDEAAVDFSLTSQGKLSVTRARVEGDAHPIFIPSRETLALYEGFVSAYENRELSLDETYYDLCKAMSGTALRGPRAEDAAQLAAPLEEVLGGKIRLEGSRFSLRTAAGDMEAHLLSEGLRKTAGLLHLIVNGSLKDRSVLFWDEPEANLNPRLITRMVDTLLALARRGVQIFLASHDYLLTQSLSLQVEYDRSPVPMRFFSLSPHPDGIVCAAGDTLADLDDNPILSEFSAHYDRGMALFAGENP